MIGLTNTSQLTTTSWNGTPITVMGPTVPANSLDTRNGHLQSEEWTASVCKWKPVECLDAVLIPSEWNAQLSVCGQSSIGHQLSMVVRQ